MESLAGRRCKWPMQRTPSQRRTIRPDRRAGGGPGGRARVRRHGGAVRGRRGREGRTRVSRTGLILAAGLALAVLPHLVPPPPGLPAEGWRVAGIGLAMALWWMTEAIPLPATALVPLAAFPAAGIAPIEAVAPSYAHPLIILFLG